MALKTFVVVRPTLTCDPESQVPAGVFIPGQSLGLNFAVVGFGLDAKQQPSVTFEMRTLAEKGRPTVAKPVTDKVQERGPRQRPAGPVPAGAQPGRPLPTTT